MRPFSSCLAVLMMFGFLLPVPALLHGQDTANAPTSAPDAAAQAEAMKLVHDIYKNDIAKAKKPEEKAALAKKVLQTATETTDDPAGQYALFVLAKDLATEGQDDGTAFAVIDEMTRPFMADDLAMKLDVLTRILAEIRKGSDITSVNRLTAQITEITVIHLLCRKPLQ